MPGNPVYIGKLLLFMPFLGLDLAIQPSVTAIPDEPSERLLRPWQENPTHEGHYVHKGGNGLIKDCYELFDRVRPLE